MGRAGASTVNPFGVPVLLDEVRLPGECPHRAVNRSIERGVAPAGRVVWEAHIFLGPGAEQALTVGVAMRPRPVCCYPATVYQHDARDVVAQFAQCSALGGDRESLRSRPKHDQRLPPVLTCHLHLTNRVRYHHPTPKPPLFLQRWSSIFPSRRASLLTVTK